MLKEFVINDWVHCMMLSGLVLENGRRMVKCTCLGEGIFVCWEVGSNGKKWGEPHQKKSFFICDCPAIPIETVKYIWVNV